MLRTITIACRGACTTILVGKDTLCTMLKYNYVDVAYELVS